MRSRYLPLLLPGLLALGLAVSGCTAPGGSSAASADANGGDPWENTNREIFSFNQGVDHYVLVPVAKGYRAVVPPPMRQSLHDFMQNLDEPIVFANDVLQAQPGLAAKTLGRAAINSTIGIGGLFDIAKQAGIPHHANDLGITLATWGVGPGPYIMIPVLGPSNVRDLTGQIADSFGDPGDYVAGEYHYVWAAVARSTVQGVDARSRNIETLADIERTSLDYYATLRSLYQQRRAAEIRHEQTNLPSPNPLGGGDSGPETAISYSVAKPGQPPGQPQEPPPK
jgi:phospholipid-binding lipoprotein MlaA